ncbi:MAG TPA: hypothetical protein DCE80_14075 [Ignavibacteriales bacterium]|nr:MAG: hypothetical protein A2Y09_10145 [Planctomycetes bacterium GWA2_39_15]HAB53275.1 hypothetical protein [Ignavibacteriales bacterium]
MNNDQIIYSISIEDILTVIEDNNLKLEIKKEDIPFIEDKIGDFMGDKWCDAIEYALLELKQSRKNSNKK